jgi:hypothetical protein
MHAATGEDKGKGESTQQGEKDADRSALKQCAVPKPFGTVYGASMEFENCGKYGRPHDGEAIEEYPELFSAPRTVRRTTRRPAGPIRGRGDRG